MNLSMSDTKNVILALKRVKRERHLSLDKILIMMNDNDSTSAVSKTTLSRVFAKGSEDQIFKYETTLRPIANVLLDIEHIETDDDSDTIAMKSILKLKKDIIEGLEEKIQTIRSEEELKYHEKLEEETEKFQKSLKFVKNQIELKDKRIDQLLDDNARLIEANVRLLNQVLDCPLKKKDCENEN